MKIIIPHIILITATLLPFTITIINALYVNIGLNTVLNGPKSIKFNPHEKVRLRIHLFAAIHLVGFYFLTNYYLELGNAKTYAFLIFSATSGLVLLGSFSKGFKSLHEHKEGSSVEQKIGNGSEYKDAVNKNQTSFKSNDTSYIGNPSDWKVSEKNNNILSLEDSNLIEDQSVESPIEDVKTTSKVEPKDKPINDLIRTQSIRFFNLENGANSSYQHQKIKLDFTINPKLKEYPEFYANAFHSIGFIPEESIDNMIELIKTGKSSRKIIFRSKNIFENQNKNSLPLNFLAFYNLIMKNDLLIQYDKAEKPANTRGFCEKFHTKIIDNMDANFELDHDLKDVLKGYFLTKKKDHLYKKMDDIGSLISIKGKQSQ